MSKLRRTFSVLLLVGLLVFAFAVVGSATDQLIKIGATPVPHAEILEFIKPFLAERGIKLEIVEFTDYVTPNLALADGSIDANYFQHIPYLDQFKKDHGLDLTYTVKVNIYPIGLYSKKIDSIKELPDGATIALPNDPTNEGRAFLILEQNGLIEIDQQAKETLLITPLDVVYNPKKLKFKELEAALLPRALDDVTAAFINTNYALGAGLNPAEDPIIREGKESPYANVVAVRTVDKNNPLIEKLGEYLTSEKVKKYILERYDGAIVPVF